MSGTSQRLVDMLKAEMFVQSDGVGQKGSGFEIAAFKTLLAGMIQRL